MRQKIIYSILHIFSLCTGKFFLYINKNQHNNLGKTAVQDMFGSWHVGNVYDKNDFAYGIAQNGLVEATETSLYNLILAELKNQSPITMYDIGANIGYYGIIAAAKFQATTYSFEPLKEYADCIVTASKLNGVTGKMFVYNIALSNQKGSANFTKAGSGSSLEKDFNETPGLQHIVVNTEKLDNVVHKGIAYPDFIKIDVEGHEYAVLEGAHETFNKALPVVFIELCTTLKGINRSYTNPYYEKTLQYFSEKNYQMYLIKSGGKLEEWGHGKNINKAGMFLCLHEVKHKLLLEKISQSYKVLS